MNNYLTLREKIMSKMSFKNLTEIEKKLQFLITKFNGVTEKEIEKLFKEKLIKQYEKQKENVTFATLIKKSKDNFDVSIVIFDIDFTYSNILLKRYDSLEKATEYFNCLKKNIKTLDINSLSLYILNNL